MIESKSLGHEIIYNGKEWEYKDSGEPITDNLRACSNCGKLSTEKGHDNCLWELPGITNACCGHGGNTDEAYVQFLDGFAISGKDAIIIQEILKKYNR